MRILMLVFVLFVIAEGAAHGQSAPTPGSVNSQIFACPARGPMAREGRMALVIGNQRYAARFALKTPEEDARAMAGLLCEHGFETLAGLDLTIAEMRGLINVFAGRLAHGGVGVFYFAGHGFEQAGVGRILGIDFASMDGRTSRAEVERASISLSALRTAMAEPQNSFNIIILDSCRRPPEVAAADILPVEIDQEEDSAELSIPDFGSSLAALNPLGDRWAGIESLTGFATESGYYAADVHPMRANHGLYSGELLSTLRRPQLSIDRVFELVRGEVVRLSDGVQAPALLNSASHGSSFYLSRTPDADEDAAWRLIQAIGRAGFYQTYLREFPGGTYVAEAARWLKERGHPLVASIDEPAVARTVNMASTAVPVLFAPGKVTLEAPSEGNLTANLAALSDSLRKLGEARPGRGGAARRLAASSPPGDGAASLTIVTPAIAPGDIASRRLNFLRSMMLAQRAVDASVNADRVAIRLQRGFPTNLAPGEAFRVEVERSPLR